VPWVDGYLYLNLATIQAVGLKQAAAVDGNWPVVAESNERTQQHPREARAVSACGPKSTILAKGAVGVVIHVHLQKQIMKAILTHCIQLGEKSDKTGPKANSSNKK
jgi:hypothetical protein